MEPSFDTFSVLNFLGAAQGFFLGIFLLVNKSNDLRANRIFSIILIIFSIQLIDSVLYYTKLALVVPEVIFLGNLLSVALAPLFYFYLRAVTSKTFRFNKWHLLHFIPLVLSIAIFFLGYHLQSREIKIAILLSEYDFIEHAHPYVVERATIIANTLASLQVFIYLILSIAIFRRHSEKLKKDLRSLTATNEKIKSGWLKYVLASFALIWLFNLLVFSAMVSGFNPHPHTNQLLFFTVSIFVYGVSYHGLKKPLIFLGTESKSIVQSREKSRPHAEASNEHLGPLLLLMEVDKPFTDPNLTLELLSQKLSISTRLMSQILNEQLNQNFSEFVNRYRVDEAKMKLRDSKNNNYTILAIAYESGFNSKSVFNAAFKKYAGVKPSEFKNFLTSQN